VQNTDFDSVCRVSGRSRQASQGNGSSQCLERKTTMHKKIPPVVETSRFTKPSDARFW
jgi:hypothetical protein